MAQTVTLSEAKVVKYHATDTGPSVDEVDVRAFRTSTNEDGDYVCQVYLDEARIPLRKLLGSDQERLAAIIDGGGSEVDRENTVVKEALENEDYHQRP